MSRVVVLMHRIVGPVPRCWWQPNAGGELRLVIKANALNVTRPGQCYQSFFLFATREVPERSPACMTRWC